MGFDWQMLIAMTGTGGLTALTMKAIDLLSDRSKQRQQQRQADASVSATVEVEKIKAKSTDDGRWEQLYRDERKERLEMQKELLAKINGQAETISSLQLELAEYEKSDTRERISILYIEDDASQWHLVESFLDIDKEFAYKVRGCTRLAEGLDILKRRAFDMILLDLGLACTTGVQGVVSLRQAYPQTSIVVITGNIHMKDEALTAGAVGFLPKPCSPLDMIAAVKLAAGRGK